MFKQKNIISFLIISFLLSSVWLFYFSTNILDQDKGKNWWSLYFENPKSIDSSFVIENHSNENNFHWIILSDNDKLDEGDTIIEKGAMLNLNPTIPTEVENKKITVQVILVDDKKEIYKNL